MDDSVASRQQLKPEDQKSAEDSKKEQPQQDVPKPIVNPAVAIGEAAERSGSDGPVILGGNQPDDLAAGPDANPSNSEGASDLETANTFWGGYGGGWGWRRPSYGYGGYGGYGGGWRRGYGDYGYGGGWGWRGRGLYGGWGWGSPYWYY